MKDKSPRTVAISRPTRSLIAAMALLIVAAMLMAAGFAKYNSVVQHSSSPVGTNMVFKRSQATTSLKGIYTDKNKSAMIARIGVDPGSATRLPSKGSDYRVFVSSPSIPDGVKEIDVLFGRLGTDGDMFLVLPKPTEAVYTMFIMNTKYLSSGQDAVSQAQSMTQDNPDDLSAQEKSITEAMSEYEYDPNEAKDGGGEVEMKSDTSDIVSFRMTLDPALKNDPRYTPIVLDTTLLNSDGTFNFEGMFNKLFKESAYDDLSREHDRINNLEDQTRQSQAEYQSRLEENPSDRAASQALQEATSSLDQLEDQKSTIAKQLNSYEQLQYNSSTFSNVQTKAKVVDENVK